MEEHCIIASECNRRPSDLLAAKAVPADERGRRERLPPSAGA
ncbi:MAG TPA: hypothetical protein PKZ03_02295 [Methanothrix sp.]|nr:hypothetical protein [Methanothrix sp.]HPW72724.1 hypothetical protein [Methanothrix sp.]